MTVVRVAGLPGESARVGRLPETVRRLRDLRDLRRGMRDRGDRAADLLYPAIGGCEDRDVRRALLACRRAVHNGRAPLPLPEGALARLTEEGRELLDRLRSDHERWERDLTRAKEAFRTERTEASHRLAALVRDEDFLRALAMASDALFPDVEAWLAGPPDAAEHLNTRRRVLSYVLRTALKTSPFSTLTTAGLIGGTVDGESAEVSSLGSGLPAPDRLSRHLELNAEIESRLERLLVAAHGPRILRANPTLTVSGERLLVVHPDGRFLGVPALPWVLRLVERAGRGAAPTELVELLTEEFGAGEEEASTSLDRLVTAGVLQADLDVPDQISDRPSAIADRLESPAGDPVRRLAEAVRDVEKADEPTGRWMSLGLLRSATERALSAAGGDATLIPGKYLCYEDAVPDWNTPPRAPDLKGMEEDLHRVRRLVAVFDGALPGRLAMADLIERRFGAGTPVGPVEAWMAWGEAVASPGGTMAAGGGGGELRELRENPFHLGETGLPRVEELRRIQAGLLDVLFPEDHDGDTVHADTEALDRSLSDLPPWLPHDHPTTLFLQPLPDGTVVFNAAAPGHGASAARVSRRAGRSAREETWEGPLRVEVMGLFRSSLNRVAPLASHELEWPGCVPTLPPERRVRPADLEIRVNPDSGLPTLWWRVEDRPVRLIHRGTMARCWLPPALRFLLDLTTPLSEAWALVGRSRELYVDPKPSEISILPRLRVGRVLLERRTWIVPCREFDGAGGDDFDRFSEVRERAEELGLPEVVFARAADPGGSAEEQVMAKAKDRKPRPLDLCSWWGVEELSRMSKGRETLVFQEAAPAVFGPDRVAEYAVELPGDRP